MEGTSLIRPIIWISKVIINKSRSVVSLLEQDTIEYVSKHKTTTFFYFILCQKCFHRLQCFKKKFAYENMKKTALKVADLAQCKPKSQFLLFKNLPPRDFSIMTLHNLSCCFFVCSSISHSSFFECRLSSLGTQFSYQHIALHLQHTCSVPLCGFTMA